MNHTEYRTMSDLLSQLKEKGFSHGFKLESNTLICHESGNEYDSGDLKIVGYHRFEGLSNPADMSVVFAVECNDGTKGVIISSYGTYADKPLIQFMDQVTIQDPSYTTG